MWVRTLNQVRTSNILRQQTNKINDYIEKLEELSHAESGLQQVIRLLGSEPATESNNPVTSLDPLFGSSLWAYQSRFRGDVLLLQLQGLTELYQAWDAGLLYPTDYMDTVLYAALLPGLVAVPLLDLKVQLLCATFILARASLPRLRFDQLTALCWKYLFPLALTGSLLVTGLHYGFTLHYMALETAVRVLDDRFWFLVCSGSSCVSPKGLAQMELAVPRHTGFAVALLEWDLEQGLPTWAAETARQSR